MKAPAWLSSMFGKGSLTLSMALLLLMLALVMPRLQLPRAAYEYVIVFDITQSMNVKDYELDGAPVSRLAHAREAVRRALPRLPCGSRIGWGAFAEYRTILLLAPVEVCSAYDDLLASLEYLDGSMRWSNASEVRKGVFWALRMAKELDSRPDLIFVTDGHEAPPLAPDFPLPLFEDLSPGEVRGWLIGAGEDALSPIPKLNAEGAVSGYWRAFEVVQTEGGREHLSGLREAHLQGLAGEVGLQYARMTGLDSIDAAMRNPLFARRTVTPTNAEWLPALAALLLLALRWRPVMRGRSPDRAAGDGRGISDLRRY
jgi:mxaL protein